MARNVAACGWTAESWTRSSNVPPPLLQDEERMERDYEPRRGKRKKGMGDLLGDIFDF